MAKIADVVKLKTGYANFVNLKSAYDEAKENADRMAMYRPTKSHRKAFERLCRGIYQPADRKFYLLSGSYGTGKSHLCLMFANFLSRSSGDPGIRGFYENYEKLDSETARMLKNIRKDGQYLVAICDYNSGRRFEEVVLKGILDACRSMNLEVTIQTEFNEAERLLEEWEKKGHSGVRNFYEDFERSLIKISPDRGFQQYLTQSPTRRLDSAL
jgi:energy-coupling factor transporter ATP-binding protein EcfA2